MRWKGHIECVPNALPIFPMISSISTWMSCHCTLQELGKQIDDRRLRLIICPVLTYFPNLLAPLDPASSNSNYWFVKGLRCIFPNTSNQNHCLDKRRSKLKSQDCRAYQNFLYRVHLTDHQWWNMSLIEGNLTTSPLQLDGETEWWLITSASPWPWPWPLAFSSHSSLYPYIHHYFLFPSFTISASTKHNIT